MKTPSISVAIPAHGRTDLFQETLESLRHQKFRDFELIVSDDSLRPEDRERIRHLTEQFKLQHENTQYVFTKPGLHQPANTNQALKATKGKYIRILHSDDLLSPLALEYENKVLDAMPDYGIITHELVRFSEFPEWNEDIYFTSYDDPARFYRLRAMAAPLPSSFIMRRSVYESIGGMNETIRSFCDTEYFSRWSCYLARHHLKLGFLSKGLVGWRIHTNNSTTLLRDEKFFEAVRTYQLIESNQDGLLDTLVPAPYRKTFFKRARLRTYKRNFRLSKIGVIDSGVFSRFFHLLKLVRQYSSPPIDGSISLIFGIMAKRFHDALRHRKTWGRLPTSEIRFLNHAHSVKLDVVLESSLTRSRETGPI